MAVPTSATSRARRAEAHGELLSESDNEQGSLFVPVPGDQLSLLSCRQTFLSRPPVCTLTSYLLFVFCFASRQGLSHPSQADLELTVRPRLASDSQQSMPWLLMPWLTDVSPHRDRPALTLSESRSVPFTHRKDVRFRSLGPLVLSF